MVNEVFLALYRTWIDDLRSIAAQKPEIGASSLANAMELWLWTLQHLQTAKDATGAKLFSGNRHGVVFPMVDALCWLLASRHQILDVLELEAKGPSNAVVAEGLEGLVNFFSDLCAVQAANAAGEASRVCAELVFGFNAPGVGLNGHSDAFAKLRLAVDASLAGARLAKDRAADALTKVMIPEALDYP
jgi:hypothetical protein